MKNEAGSNGIQRMEEVYSLLKEWLTWSRRIPAKSQKLSLVLQEEPPVIFENSFEQQENGMLCSVEDQLDSQ